MTQLISSFNGKTVHISTSTGTSDVTTLCGRTFGVARMGHPIHYKECPKCAKVMSFRDASSAAMNEYKAGEAARVAKRKAAIEKDKRALAAHRDATSELINVLLLAGLDMEYNEKPGGVEISFYKDGFKFSLSGNVGDRR